MCLHFRGEALRGLAPEGVEIESSAIAPFENLARPLQGSSDRGKIEVQRHVMAGLARGGEHYVAIQRLGVEQQAVHVEDDGADFAWEIHWRQRNR